MRRKGTDERKTAEHFLDAVSAFDWNKGAFANAFVFEHPELQARGFDSMLAVISALADEYIGGRCDVRNQEAGRLAWVIRCALIDDAEKNDTIYQH